MFPKWKKPMRAHHLTFNSLKISMQLSSSFHLLLELPYTSYLLYISPYTTGFIVKLYCAGFTQFRTYSHCKQKYFFYMLHVSGNKLASLSTKDPYTVNYISLAFSLYLMLVEGGSEGVSQSQSLS